MQHRTPRATRAKPWQTGKLLHQCVDFRRCHGLAIGGSDALRKDVGAACRNALAGRGWFVSLADMNALLPLFLALVPASTSPTPPQPSAETLALIRGVPIMEFSVGETGRMKTVQIWANANQADIESLHIVAHMTTRITTGLVVQMSDSTQCPALRQVSQSLAQLSLPMPALTGTSTPSIFGGGATYRLTSNALYGGAPATIQVSAGDDTPLAAWVTANMTALAPCFPPPVG